MLKEIKEEAIIATVRWRDSGETIENLYISVLAETIANNDNPDYEILDFEIITKKLALSNKHKQSSNVSTINQNTLMNKQQPTKEQPVSNDTTTQEAELIGVLVTIRWRDSGDISENLYISIEEFPEGAPEDDYILPKAQIRDDQVFQYYELIELAETLENDDNPDYEILDWEIITENCQQ